MYCPKLCTEDEHLPPPSFSSSSSPPPSTWGKRSRDKQWRRGGILFAGPSKTSACPSAQFSSRSFVNSRPDSPISFNFIKLYHFRLALACVFSAGPYLVRVALAFLFAFSLLGHGHAHTSVSQNIIEVFRILKKRNGDQTDWLIDWFITLNSGHPSGPMRLLRI